MLALGTVGGAFPAVAARAGSLPRRAAAGALGAWWLLLAEAATGRHLLLGAPADAAHGGTDAVAAIVTSPAIALLGVWAAAAAVLPYLVRGRLLVADGVSAMTPGRRAWRRPRRPRSGVRHGA